MTRLPPIPNLSWREDGTPVASAFDDVYFSTANGLEESRTVFLQGCGLPERWHKRERFTVAETGFGTGLNLLALWQLWLANRPSPTARLNFVSFEAYPLDAEQAQRALAAWPELAVLTQQLIRVWPQRAEGVQQFGFPGDGLNVTLHIGDIAETLPQARICADAWFLDGFSPARNSEMWAPDLYPEFARNSAADAVAATFTVAGHVRRGLTEAGFDVAKQPGFGRKRQRLVARASSRSHIDSDPFGLRSPDLSPHRIAVLGSGIAGACAAYALSRRGHQVVLHDPNGLATGASGNPLALVMPRLDAENSPAAQVALDAYLAARHLYAGLPGAHFCDVSQHPRHAKDETKFEKLLADPPLPLEDLEALAGGGLLHKRALILEPAKIIKALTNGLEFSTDTIQMKSDPRTWPSALGADAVILANGVQLRSAIDWLGLTDRLGQVEYVSNAPDAPATAAASGHYVLSAGSVRLWGATFEPGNGSPTISSAAREANNAARDALQPWWRAQIRHTELHSRAGLRATTTDRLPIAGPMPDFDIALEKFAALKQGRMPAINAPLIEGVWCLGGLGSRGFTYAPWLANILTAQLNGDPAPASQQALEHISPLRMIHRGLKRGVF